MSVEVSNVMILLSVGMVSVLKRGAIMMLMQVLKIFTCCFFLLIDWYETQTQEAEIHS